MLKKSVGIITLDYSLCILVCPLALISFLEHCVQLSERYMAAKG